MKMQKKREIKKFRLVPKYPHNRSEGTSNRWNKGMVLQRKRVKVKGNK